MLRIVIVIVNANSGVASRWGVRFLGRRLVRDSEGAAGDYHECREPLTTGCSGSGPGCAQFSVNSDSTYSNASAGASMDAEVLRLSIDGTASDAFPSRGELQVDVAYACLTATAQARSGWKY